MRHTDRILRKRLKRGAPTLPLDTRQHLDEQLEQLSRSATPFHRSPASIALRATVAALALAFFILPNVSKSIAYAMQELPIIGPVVRVISVYSLDTEDEYHQQHIAVPELDAQAGMEDSVKTINDDVKSLTDAAIAQFEKDTADIPEAHQSLYIDYEVLTNTDDWFTLRILISRVTGSGCRNYYFYHIDKRTGDLVTLSDLFVPGFDYVTPLTENIQAQMCKRMEEDEKQHYWYDPADDAKSLFREIRLDQDFYWNEDGDLVIVFQKYEVAPGAMGTPEFVIPREVYESGLLGNGK